MNIENILEICEKILNDLCNMSSEIEYLNNCSSSLIYPKKIQDNGNKIIKRISEQELKILFILELKNYENIFFSVETPTIEKYQFKGLKNRRSAMIDLTLFKKNKNNILERDINIEFKHKSKFEFIKKDIEKLITEKESGVFIHLLKNIDSGTFCNKDKEKGLFNKLHKSFNKFGNHWENEDKKILIIFLIKESKNKSILHRYITKSDINNLNSIFLTKENNCKIQDINDIEGWKYKKLI